MDAYKITFDSWNEVARTYQDKFMHLDLYNDTYDAFCRLMPAGQARILEIGCGPGNITAYLLGKHPGWLITGIDVAPNMIALAAANNPSATFRVMDCREIDRISGTFQGIVCGFCLPYLAMHDMQKLLRDCANLLDPGGIIYLSMLEGDHSRSGMVTGSMGHRMQLFYYEAPDVQQCMEQNGIELLLTERIGYSAAGGEKQIHLVMIGRKKSLVQIRPYRDSDEEAVMQILKQHTPRYFAPEEENDLRHYLRHETEEYYVLEYGGAIAASGGINRVDNGRTGRISWDLVHPGFQNRGLGSQLLQFRLQKLAQMEPVETIVVRTSQLAFGFYGKNGFRLTGVTPGYWAEGFDLYEMVYVHPEHKN